VGIVDPNKVTNVLSLSTRFLLFRLIGSGHNVSYIFVIIKLFIFFVQASTATLMSIASHSVGVLMAFPVAAIVCISVGVYVAVIVIFLLIWSVLQVNILVVDQNYISKMHISCPPEWSMGRVIFCEQTS